MSRVRSILLEVVQFVPLLVLAAPFVVAGAVDLSAAGTAFLVAAALAVPLVGILAWREIPQNPILLGVDAWLVAGALGFAVLPPLAAALSALQAGGMFVGILFVGLVLTLRSPGGFLGVRLEDADTVRRGSRLMLACAVAALVWSLVFPDIRIGGALPFILLNVVRRVFLRRATR